MRRTLIVLIALMLIGSVCLAQNATPAPTAEPKVIKKVLDNGLTVIIKPEKGSGLVAVVALVRAGAAQESFQNAGIGNFVAHLLLASTIQRSAERVASIADEVGGNISARWQQDYTEIRTVTTSTKFNTAMTLIGECLTEANFEPKWVEQIRADLLKSIRTESDDIFDNSYTDLRQQLYQDNGYRRPMSGLERTIRLASPQDLQKFYSMYYMPNNTVLSIVGDVTVEQALDRAKGAYAGVLSGKLPRDLGVPDETLERSKFHASEVELGAAYLMAGWLAPGIGSKDYPAMAVAVNALGGGKGSIMFRELRQKRGMGYDIGTMYPKLKYQSHAIAYVITDPFKNSLTPTLVLNDIKTALIEETNNLKTTPLSAQDLERAKGYTIGTYALQHQHMIDRAFLLGWSEAIGIGYEYDSKYADDIDKVTAEDVQRVVKKYFNEYASVLLLPRSESTSIPSE